MTSVPSNGVGGGALATQASDAPVRLRIGDRLFWHGGELPPNNLLGAVVTETFLTEAVTAGAVPVPAGSCPAPPTEVLRATPVMSGLYCVKYTLDVETDGAPAVLSFAVDHPMRADLQGQWDQAGAVAASVLDVSLTAPDGTEVHASRISEQSGLSVSARLIPFSPEAKVVDPTPGLWTATVFARSVSAPTPFRVRALLEPPARVTHGVRLPNLRVVPPYGLYLAPEQVGSDHARGCFGPELPVHPDEESQPDEEAHYGEGDTACLRMAFGHANYGDGRLDLVFRSDQPVDLDGDGVDEYPVTQRLHRGDRSGFVERQAGFAEDMHEARGHNHYHYKSLFLSQLFEVADRRLIPLDQGTKLGACGHDWKNVRWLDPVHGTAGEFDSGVECARGDEDVVTHRLGLSPGFADVYPISTLDQYVPLHKVNDQWPTGEYVVITTADPEGWIAESDETDNASYTHFEIEQGPDGGVHLQADGTALITLLERGFGAGPFDPQRRVLDPSWPGYEHFDGP